MNLNIAFDDAGKIVATIESGRDIFQALLDHRLESRLTSLMYDATEHGEGRVILALEPLSQIGDLQLAVFPVAGPPPIVGRALAIRTHRRARTAPL